MQPVAVNSTLADPSSCPVLVWDDSPSRLGRILEALGDISSAATKQADCLEQLAACAKGTVIVLALAAGVVADTRCALELDLLRTLKANSCSVICLIDSRGRSNLASICRALLAGASRVIDTHAEKFLVELCHTVRETVEQTIAARLDDANLDSIMQHAGFAGRGPSSLALFRSIRTLSALTDLPVLITGETGTGKELVALAIHSMDSKRSHRPFVSVNCAALTEQLAESELFGHQRGSFTGADRDRSGLFRTAEGGVLFLDEVGELSWTMQAKLLRVLQTNRVRSVGADRETGINVRVVSATNRPLEQMIREGSFRVDLFHRLNVLSLQIAPLRQRPEDIAPLIQHFVQRLASVWPAGNPPVFSRDFVEALKRSELPGNVRQLENLVRRAVVGWDGSEPISLSALPPEIWRELSAAVETPGVPDPSEPATTAARVELTGGELENHALQYLQHHGWSLGNAIRHLESILVLGALSFSGGNQSEAARLLGVTPRSVYNKLHKEL